jgi:glycosyltransferase involved in cell wall biosynthesis
MASSESTRQPKVSVIIPTFNRCDLVCETIDSVLGQTLRDFEIVVVDDGSTDGTQEVLLSRFGQRIKYAYQENRGRSAARNRGILESSGEYVLFLDSDDLLLSQSLELLSSYLDAHAEVGVVYADGYYCDEDGQNIAQISETRPPLRGENMLEALVLSNVIVLTHSAMLRRSCLDVLGCPYFDENLSASEDADLWIRLAHSGCVFEYLDELTCKYRMHRDNTYSIRSDDFQRAKQSFGVCRRKAFNSIYFPSLSSWTQRAYMRMYFLDYMAPTTDAQEEIFDSPSFKNMHPENQAEVLYFAGVDNIVREHLTTLGRERIRKALALHPLWKYRVVLLASYLGWPILNLVISLRRGLAGLKERRDAHSPIYAQFLESC